MTMVVVGDEDEVHSNQVHAGDFLIFVKTNRLVKRRQNSQVSVPKKISLCFRFSRLDLEARELI